MVRERVCKVVLGTLSQQLRLRGVACTGFVLTPNHLHCLLQFRGRCSTAEFIQRWKQESGLRANQAIRNYMPEYAAKMKEDEPFWQRKFYDFPIESSEKLEEKLSYIHNNPVRADLVATPIDWRWSSARWYAARRSVGVPIAWPG